MKESTSILFTQGIAQNHTGRSILDESLVVSHDEVAIDLLN